MSDAPPRSPRDELRFLRSLVTRPRAIGAIAPSSPALARKIAEQIDPTIPGSVLELGPGTGVITEALIARGISVDRLIAIEADPDLAKLMRERFPSLRIVEADAFDLDRSLPVKRAPAGGSGIRSAFAQLSTRETPRAHCRRARPHVARLSFRAVFLWLHRAGSGRCRDQRRTGRACARQSPARTRLGLPARGSLRRIALTAGA